MELTFREAVRSDLRELVLMLADDHLGATREDTSEPLNEAYVQAFEAIEKDPNNELVVVESSGDLVVMLQLTYIPYVNRTGAWRCIIEGVRIQSAFRGQGLGHRFFEWAIAKAKERGCRIVQLTSDKQRPDAIRFYQQLGFQASHEGLKLDID